MGQPIRIAIPPGSISGYRAAPDGPARGALVLVQEIFGVNSHIRGVAGQRADYDPDSAQRSPERTLHFLGRHLQ